MAFQIEIISENIINQKLNLVFSNFCNYIKPAKGINTHDQF